MKKLIKLPFIIALMLIASSCSNTVERLGRIGKEPKFTNIDLPTIEEDEEQKERNEVLYAKQHEHQRKTNSLWQPGSNSFFRDSRAWRVGDIIRVKVQIADTAAMANTTNQRRSGTDDAGITSLYGKAKNIATVLSKTVDPTKLISTNNSRNHNGSGNITRSETIRTEIAAIVTKVLQNGNLVVQGHQEVRINSELREVKVGGIIRPRDIASDNSVSTNQLAEARISYGGRGIVTDMQRPRVGSEIVDIISPF